MAHVGEEHGFGGCRLLGLGAGVLQFFLLGDQLVLLGQQFLLGLHEFIGLLLQLS